MKNKDNIIIFKQIMLYLFNGTIAFAATLYFYGYISLKWFFLIKYRYLGPITDFYTVNEVLVQTASGFIDGVAGVFFIIAYMSHLATKGLFLLRANLRVYLTSLVVVISIIISAIYFLYIESIVTYLYESEWPLVHFIFASFLFPLAFSSLVLLKRHLSISAPFRYFFFAIFLYVALHITFLQVGAVGSYARSVKTKIVTTDKQNNVFENVRYLKNTKRGILVFEPNSQRLFHIANSNVKYMEFKQDSTKHNYFTKIK